MFANSIIFFGRVAENIEILVDLEILELVNVFKSLKLKPDKISITEIESFLNNKNISSDDSTLINEVSLRFQYLERLKDAIIFLPLKPPMQYYYVSSPFGMRIHPRTKKKQMHKGIDMAGTWQEEVRASADGQVVFSGKPTKLKSASSHTSDSVSYTHLRAHETV